MVKGRALVMAKILKPQVVQRIEEIMAVADALMVARGDLGVETPPSRFQASRDADPARTAARQAVVVRDADAGTDDPWPVPTRAEVSDVATAVFEGADAVMLSAESASANIRTRRSRP